jgi:predicted amidohydrolase
MRYLMTILFLPVCLLYPAVVDLRAAQPGEILLDASAFESVESATQGGWEQNAPRDEISPAFSVARTPSLGQPGSLELYGASNSAVRGCWRTLVKGVEAGRFYRFEASFAARSVDFSHNTAFARLEWTDAGGKQTGQREYVPELDRNDIWQKVGGVFRAPEKAAGVRVELYLSQKPQARVFWDDIRLTRVPDLPKRPVRLATVNCRPGGSATPAASIEQFCQVVEQAGQKGADIVCLGEGVNLIGVLGKEYQDIAEPIPGPSTDRLAELARRHKMYIVAALGEREGRVIYNTAVLIDRQGKIAGKYRKVCIPEGEFDQGVAQGDSYPVFDTDFGRIGIMICWDSWFVDPARALSLQGAEVIFLPIWGGNPTLLRARAIENHVYLAICGYDCASQIYDPWGELLAEAKERPCVATADIDLNYPPVCPFPWPLGDTRQILLQARRNDIRLPALEH